EPVTDLGGEGGDGVGVGDVAGHRPALDLRGELAHPARAAGRAEDLVAGGGEGPGGGGADAGAGAGDERERAGHAGAVPGTVSGPTAIHVAAALARRR